MFNVVAPVVLPRVIVLALAFVPMFIAPLVPESNVTVPVVPEVIDTLPVVAVNNVIPFVPELSARPVAPVALPTVIVFAFAFVPIFTEPVDPESKLRAPVVPDVTFNANPAAEERERVLFVVIDVAPVPVNVAESEATDRRVAPLVIKFNPFASVVPRFAAEPYALPP